MLTTHRRVDHHTWACGSTKLSQITINERKKMILSFFTTYMHVTSTHDGVLTILYILITQT